MKECMICKLKMKDTGDFRTTDGDSLCAEDYKRVSYHYRKGLFTTEEVLQVKTMMEEELSKRRKIFEQITRIGVTNNWTLRDYRTNVNKNIDLVADQVFGKNGAQFLNPRELTEALQKALENLLAIYYSDSAASLATAPYSDVVMQYYNDINPDVQFSKVAHRDTRDTYDKLIKIN